ncbi:DUF2922 family protein [Thermolongibacillus altinsuensis]|uniref:DUF2922 family protein n=1 Tax=Thermolongibacillus altinsuensis TaxID=575256 RepID=A0A4R1QDA2_9BACL|nr:DUF2922 domain-containing protein [Thermolongibacillus altinsuensis]TCL49222.1 DUF2922 family protein [Thermolongibacillus altinsuensis]GMB08670.1 hypothetical protein B1no1_13800 [Thermolongibacillus altinsuensis]
MEKTLELQFVNQEGKVVRLTIDQPLESLTDTQVANVMDLIIAANVFTSSGGDLVAKKGARIVSKEVLEWAFA